MRLSARTNDKEKYEHKQASEIVVGDTIMINDTIFKVVKVDEEDKNVCFVDKYACDYVAGKSSKVKIISKNEREMDESKDNS